MEERLFATLSPVSEMEFRTAIAAHETCLPPATSALPEHRVELRPRSRVTLVGKGSLTTETVRAFTEEEYRKIMGEL